MRRTLTILLPCAAVAAAIAFFLTAGSGERQPAGAPPAAAEVPAPGAEAPAAEPGAGQTATPAAPAVQGSALRVRLTAAATGEPLAGVEAAFSLHRAGRRDARTAAADGRGEVEVGGLTAGRYSLTTSVAGYLADTRAIEVEEGAAAEVDIALRAGETLEGEVVEAGGEPLAGVQVRLALAGAASPRNARAVTGERGEFAAGGLEPGAWSLTAFKPGFLSRTIEVVVPSTPVQIELAADPGIEVAVVDVRGAPVPGARVFAPRRTRGTTGLAISAVTPVDGKVRIAGPAEGAGELAIEVTHRAYLPWKKTLPARELSTGPVEVVLAEGVELSGTVRDGTGAPVAGAELRLAGPLDSARDRPGAAEAGAEGKSVNATAAGEFAWKGLAPGLYEVTACSPRAGSLRVSGIDLTGGGRSDLELVLESRPGPIAGRLADREGRPIALCPVELEAVPPGAGGPPAPSLRTVSGRDGGFRFEVLPAGGAGAHRLRAGGGKWSRTVVEGVEAGNEEVAVLVEPLGSIRGFVAAPEGLDGYAVQVTRAGAGEGAAFDRTYRFPSADRWFRIRDLEPGTYALTLVTPGAAAALPPAASVEVLPGKETGPVELGRE